jgi:hypothetical protein
MYASLTDAPFRPHMDRYVLRYLEVAAAVRRWRTVAAAHGLTPAQSERMESAFEHDDLRAARALRV